MPIKNRQIILASRPRGEPTPNNFRLVETKFGSRKPARCCCERFTFRSIPTCGPHECGEVLCQAGRGRRSDGRTEPVDPRS